MDSWPALRAPTWAADFQDQLEALGLDFERFDEAWESVRLVVEGASLEKLDELYPEAFSGTGLRLITTDAFPGVPALVVLVQVTASVCDIVAVNAR